MTCLPALSEMSTLAEPSEPTPAEGPRPAITAWAGTAAVRALTSRCAADAAQSTARWEGLTVVVAEAGAFCYHDHGYTRLIEPGSVIVGRAGDAWACSHGYGGGDACRVFQFGPGAEDDLARALGCGLVAGGVLAPDAGLAARLFAARVAREASAFEEAAHGLALAAAAGLRGEAAVVPPSLRRADRDRAHAAAQLVEARYAEPLGLAELAAAVGTSPFHFLRAFRTELGLTPHQYLVRTRLRHTLRLLATTELPVTEVALAVGYGDLSNFLRTFRAAVGRSPGAWRRALA